MRGDRIQCGVVVSVRRCGNRGGCDRVVAGVYGLGSRTRVALVAVARSMSSDLDQLLLKMRFNHAMKRSKRLLLA